VGFECYRIGDLLLDAGTQEVTRNGTVVPVPRLSFKLLLSLARHAPNVVSTQQLEEEVWEGLVVDRGTVNKRVLLLRKSLSRDLNENPYISVVRGSGYRLIVPVERLAGLPEEPAEESKTPHRESKARLISTRTISFVALGAIALVVLYLGFWGKSGELTDDVAEGVQSSAYETSSTAYSERAIAVLPFVDMSDNQSHNYLGDGIAEEVINLLTDMNDLEVAARTSSFAFRDTSASLSEIASRLHVGTILEGSVRHTDTRIRVTAQLINAQSGYHIWSQNYDRSFDEVFAVQDDIAFNIAQKLKLTLDESDQPGSRKSMTADMEAFRLYLKGRDLLNDRIRVRSEGLYTALEYFNEAISLDPMFASAHAGIASVSWLLTSYDRDLDKETWYEKAEACAMFALEVDPGSVEALGALAAISSERGDVERAADLFNQARAIDGSKSDLIAWEATLHLRLGYFEELLRPLSVQYQRDPLNEIIAWALADSYIYSGKPEEAIAILEGLQNFTYRDYYLALASIYSGDLETARVLLRDVRMRSGRMPATYADLLVDALEDPAKKDEVVEKIVTAVETGGLDRLVGFEELLILGSPRAFELGIDPVTDIKNLQLHAQIWNNWAVDFRQDPRFKDWVAALGYVKFWRKHGWPDRCRPTGPNDFECI
jgi:TolB-like protein/DNA-binding winged helix-turn-helix (wHTH) protein